MGHRVPLPHRWRRNAQGMDQGSSRGRALCQGLKGLFTWLIESLLFFLSFFPFISTLPVRRDLCQFPAEPGSCQKMLGRYFYSPEQKTCRAFRYSGCKGNSNNFKTVEECEKVCGKISPGMEHLVFFMAPNVVFKKRSNWRYTLSSPGLGQEAREKWG